MKGNAARKVTSIVILVAVSLILFVTGFYSFAWFADMCEFVALVAVP